jgi:hypothetical protein
MMNAVSNKFIHGRCKYSLKEHRNIALGATRSYLKEIRVNWYDTKPSEWDLALDDLSHIDSALCACQWWLHASEAQIKLWHRDIKKAIEEWKMNN